LKQNNLAGDFEKLTGSIDSVFLKSASGANEALRGLVQGAEDLVDGIGNIPGPVLQAGLGIAGVAGGMALLGGTFLTVLPKVQEGVEAFRNLERAAPRAATALKGAGLVGALFAITGALASVVTAIEGSKIERSVGRTTTALIELARQNKNIQQCSILLDDLFQKKDGSDIIAGINGMDAALTRMFKKDWSQTFSDFGGDIVHGIIPAVKGTKQELEDSFKTIDDQLAAFVQSGNAELAGDAFKKIEEKAKAQGISVEQLKTAFPAYSESLKQADADARVAAEGMEKITTSTGGTIVVTEDMQKALDDLGLSAQGAVADLDKYAAALVRAGLSNLSSADAARNYNSSILAVDEAIKANGTTLDTHTAKGIANEAALLGIASAGLAEVQVMAKATDAYGNHINSSDTLHAKMVATYNDLVANAAKFGITGEAADDLARRALGIPDNVDIEAYLKDFASKQLENVGATADRLNGKTANLSVNVAVLGLEQAQEAERLLNRNSQAVANQYASGNAYRANGGIINYLAGGGYPRFVPRGTDTVPAMLTPGEFVVTREATVANRPVLEAMNAGYKYAPAAAPQMTVSVKSDAPQAPVMGDVYVQNPFTGEYLLAQVDHRVSNGMNGVAALVGGRAR
jgi:hypothetical protein